MTPGDVQTALLADADKFSLNLQSGLRHLMDKTSDIETAVCGLNTLRDGRSFVSAESHTSHMA